MDRKIPTYFRIDMSFLYCLYLLMKYILLYVPTHVFNYINLVVYKKLFVYVDF